MRPLPIGTIGRGHFLRESADLKYFIKQAGGKNYGQRISQDL